VHEHNGLAVITVTAVQQLSSPKREEDEIFLFSTRGIKHGSDPGD